MNGAHFPQLRFRKSAYQLIHEPWLPIFFGLIFYTENVTIKIITAMVSISAINMSLASCAFRIPERQLLLDEIKSSELASSSVKLD